MYSGLSVSVVSNHALLQNYRHADVYEGVNLIQFFIKKTVHWKTGMTEVYYDLIPCLTRYQTSRTVAHPLWAMSREFCLEALLSIQSALSEPSDHLVWEAAVLKCKFQTQWFLGIWFMKFSYRLPVREISLIDSVLIKLGLNPTDSQNASSETFVWRKLVLHQRVTPCYGYAVQANSVY